jgi:flagellar hook-length control protein FliK
MSVPAISNLIASVGGKAAPPGLGDIAPEAGAGLPLGFAALLAEQIPMPAQSEIVLLQGEIIAAEPKANAAALSGILAQSGKTIEASSLTVDDLQSRDTSALDTGAESVLAALSSGSSQSFGLTAGTKDSDEKSRKLAAISDTVPSDPGSAAQYIIPAIVPPAPSRTTGATERNLQNPVTQSTDPMDSESAAPGGQAVLQDQRFLGLSVGNTSANTQTTQTPNASDWRIDAQSDSTKTAILAGDSNTGNSAGTPAFAASLASATNATGTTAQAPAISTALNSPNWAQDFGNRIVWIAKNDQQAAQININPPQLGPIQITISLNGDQASAAFASPHPEVRQVIQESLSQLRDMFSAAGISLGQANVGSQLPSQNREAAFQFANEARFSSENAILSPDSHSSSTPAGTPIQRGRGLVDLFA